MSQAHRQVQVLSTQLGSNPNPFTIIHHGHTMNATITTSPEASKAFVTNVSDLGTKEACLDAAMLLTQNYMLGMCRIMYAYVYRFKHGSREQFCEEYGKSVRQSRKYEKIMRDLRIIDAAPARGKHASPIRASKGPSVENASTTVCSESRTLPPTLSPIKSNDLQSRPVEVEVLAPQPTVREPKFKTEEARAAWHHKQQLIEQIHAIDQQHGSDWDEWHWLSDKHELHTLYTRAAQKSQAIDERIEQRVRDSFR